MSFFSFEISDPRFERDNLRHITVKSAALRQRADISVFVPPNAANMTNVPLVILLHGIYGSHWSWCQKGGVHRTALALINAGDIPPMVLAMPSDGLWGDGSGYIPHDTQDFEKWIASEVPAAVRQACPSVSPTSPTFIHGLSTGGFGALRLAFLRPSLFRAAGAHSMITSLQQLRGRVEPPAAWQVAPHGDQSLNTLAQSNRSQLPPFRFDCGTEDPLIVANRKFHSELLAAQIPHEYEEFPGEHDWPYWENHVRETLLFFSGQL